MTFFHLDPFLAHPWYHLTYWLGGYAVLVAVAPVVLVREERRHGGRLPVREPLTRLQSATGVVAAAGMSAAALALLADPGWVSGAWPWDVAPLTGRLLGVWLAAGAIAYAYALWDGDWQPRPPALPHGAAHRRAARARPAPPRRTTSDARAGRLLRARAGRRRPRAGPARAAPRRRAEPTGAEPMTARPMTPQVRAGLVAIASVIFWLGLSLFVFPRRDRDAVRMDDRAAAHRRVPRRELLGVDDARRSPARESATGCAAARSPRRT